MSVCGSEKISEVYFSSPHRFHFPTRKVRDLVHLVDNGVKISIKSHPIPRQKSAFKVPTRKAASRVYFCGNTVPRSHCDFYFSVSQSSSFFPDFRPNFFPRLRGLTGLDGASRSRTCSQAFISISGILLQTAVFTAISSSFSHFCTVDFGVFVHLSSVNISSEYTPVLKEEKLMRTADSDSRHEGELLWKQLGGHRGRFISRNLSPTSVGFIVVLM